MTHAFGNGLAPGLDLHSSQSSTPARKTSEEPERDRVGGGKTASMDFKANTEERRKKETGEYKGGRWWVNRGSETEQGCC